MDTAVIVYCYLDHMNYRHAAKRIGLEYCQAVDPGELTRMCLEIADSLMRSKCFTVLPTHLGDDAVAARMKYIKSLKKIGYQVTLGKMRKKVRAVSVPVLGLGWLGLKTQRKVTLHEEKDTDINIAIEMVKDALERKCDKMVLISGDSDYLPVIRFVLDHGIKVLVLVPPHQRVTRLRNLAQERPNELFVRQLTAEDVISSVLKEAEHDSQAQAHFDR